MIFKGVRLLFTCWDRKRSVSCRESWKWGNHSKIIWRAWGWFWSIFLLRLRLLRNWLRPIGVDSMSRYRLDCLRHRNKDKIFKRIWERLRLKQLKNLNRWKMGRVRVKMLYFLRLCNIFWICRWLILLIWLRIHRVWMFSNRVRRN